jgi:predicted protein tyrosine phosphatase
MEKSDLNRLQRKFGQALEGKHTVTLHIPDMQPELIDELRRKVSPHIACT